MFSRVFTLPCSLAGYLDASYCAHNATPVLYAPSRTSARTVLASPNGRERSLLCNARASMSRSLLCYDVATVNIWRRVYYLPEAAWGMDVCRHRVVPSRVWGPASDG